MSEETVVLPASQARVDLAAWLSPVLGEVSA